MGTTGQANGIHIHQEFHKEGITDPTNIYLEGIPIGDIELGLLPSTNIGPI
jgi:murein DD-endopeptidase MepM/ murein hydrolase activator NlpD